MSAPCFRELAKQTQVARAASIAATRASKDGRSQGWEAMPGSPVGNWKLEPEMVLKPGSWEVLLTLAMHGTTTFINSQDSCQSPK